MSAEIAVSHGGQGRELWCCLEEVGRRGVFEIAGAWCLPSHKTRLNLHRAALMLRAQWLPVDWGEEVAGRVSFPFSPAARQAPVFPVVLDG